MKSTIHQGAIQTLNAILAHLDHFKLHLPAIHVANAIDALEAHIAEGCQCNGSTDQAPDRFEFR